MNVSMISSSSAMHMGAKQRMSVAKRSTGARNGRTSVTVKAVAGTEEKVAQLLANNKKWAQAQVKYDADFFNRLKNIQTPEYLWIGCADSRVPANTIIGLDPGEVFVQRNVGNQASHRDMNCQACIEFSVNALGVKTILVCGHYKCGAVKAALTLPSKTPGLVNCWISDIREARNLHLNDLKGLPEDQQIARLCEYNVLRQVFHVVTSPTVQAAWAEGKELSIHGLCYDLEDGLLKSLVGPITGNSDIGKESYDATSFALARVVEEKKPGGWLSAIFGSAAQEPVSEPAPPKPLSDEDVFNEMLASQVKAHVSWDEGSKK